MPAAASGPREDPPKDRAGASALTLAGLAALLASTCCVLPLVLVLAGVTGAWMSRLRVLEPWSNGLAALAVAALAFAAWRLWRPLAMAEGSPCATARPRLRRGFWVVALLVAVPIVVPLAAPFFY